MNWNALAAWTLTACLKIQEHEIQHRVLVDRDRQLPETETETSFPANRFAYKRRRPFQENPPMLEK